MGLAAPLAIAALLGGLLGIYAPSGLFASAALAFLIGLALVKRTFMLMLLALFIAASQVLLAGGATLTDGLTGQDVEISGRIVEFDDQGRYQRLRLDVHSCQPLSAESPGCDRLRHVRVNWYGAPALTLGEQWAMTLRLRPPAGFANPNSFNYGAWLWREGINATGYVRDVPPPRRLAPATFDIRKQALTYLDAHTADPLSRRWLAALTLGASERLERADWDLLNATGTTHLMVISGLHVGLAATFILLLSRGLARLVTPSGWRMAVWPWWSAAGAAVAYAWLAGLEPPAMRAMIMTLVGLWVASGRHAPGPWQGWWLALAIVLLVNPLTLWQPGTWLSFIAVAMLIIAWQGRARPRGWRGWLWALLRSQCLLAPLMAAAVLLAFDRLAPAAPLVNLLAVPLVGSVMVPLGLLGWLLAWWPPLAQLCWTVFSWLASLVEHGLLLATDWFPLWQPEPWQVWPFVLGLLLLSAFWALPGFSLALRWAGSLAIVALGATLTPPTLPEGQLRVRVHDVGQGQLIELRTANHRLLYDSGPRFGSGFMPLTTLWPKGQRFDAVIISHGDLDHAGGINALVEEHDVSKWWSPGVDHLHADPLRGEMATCRGGESWQWDGIAFHFLWPLDNPARLESNDRSCVLLVEAGEQRLLISGDASASIERKLLDSLPSRITLLVAGHHGSKTSSSLAWVAATRPEHVLFSAGRHNAHGHPHPTVVRRFRDIGSCLWSTAEDGAVTFWLGKPKGADIVAQRSRMGWWGGVGGGCHEVESRS